jgi:chromosome segregation ATPase
MSKQSKQERAKRYAAGAQDAVERANVKAGEAKATMNGLTSTLDAIMVKLESVRSAHVEAKSIVEGFSAELDALNEKRREVSTEIGALSGEVRKAQETVDATAERIGAMLSEVPADATDTAQAGA